MGNPKTSKCALVILTLARVQLTRKGRTSANTSADCFQTGLVDRQILEVLQGLYRARTPCLADSTPSAPPGPGSSGEDGTIRQKAIGEGDICPICQEELMKKRLPVTHCRFGCGNNVHVTCMKVWAEYQIKSETEVMVKCPLCREDFCALKLLLQQVKTAGKLCTSSERERLDKHLGIPCNNCRICPIAGKCFKCTVCSYFHLCEECFKTSSHQQHSFAVRAKRNQPWQPVEQSVDLQLKKAQIIDSQLMHSNPTNAFSIKAPGMLDVVPEHVLKSLPVMRLRQNSKLLEMGMQCRFCLQSFHLGQHVKTLPCRHKFHSGCIEMWLRQSVCCPLDWYVIYNPLTWNSAGVKAPESTANGSRTSLTIQQRSELFIPGLGLLDRTARASALKSTRRSAVSATGPLDPSSFESLTLDTRSLCIHNTDSRTNSSEGHRKESRSRCRSSGRISVSDSRRTVGMKAYLSNRSLPLRPACVIRRMNGSEKTQQNLFPELNQHVSEAQPKNAGLHGPVRRLRLRDGKTRPPPVGGDLRSLNLYVTSIPISAKHRQNQE
ncbi:E3 ubiquitin-protein ligase ZSWIM2 isoform X1 [Salminus brasiliensis]|uniref:E3 ubiquitin-protein ligase ZSWIM2 isoform X1 n=1 Tax=Salminus brasiliensis TaxID=930266 RepID=UPI003B836423